MLNLVVHLFDRTYGALIIFSDRSIHIDSKTNLNGQRF